MVARGLLQTPEFFESRVYLASLWQVLRDVALQIENELLLGQATLTVVPEGEERAKVLSNMRKMLYPDEVSPFEALIKKYAKLLPHASGESFTIQKVGEDTDHAQVARQMMNAPAGRTRGK